MHAARYASADPVSMGLTELGCEDGSRMELTYTHINGGLWY